MAPNGMAKKERLARTLAREAVDRPPVTLWRHNFLREWSAEELADETIELYRRFDWDLIKLNPRWSYLPEAFGNRYEPPDEQRFQRELHRVVQCAEDLESIEPADRAHPSLLEQLDALARVVSAVGDEVDVLHTVFSPLSVVGLLAGGIGEPLRTYALERPAALDRALEGARETIVAHATDAIERGAAGLFFAPTQWTSLDVCDAEMYARFGRPHDLDVLARLPETRFSALHVCGNHVDMERFLDYPVEILSWDDRGEGNPRMAELAKRTDKALMAGVPHRRIHRLEPEALRASIREAVADVDRGLILAGGCAVGALLDGERLRAVRDVAERLDD